VKEMIRLVYIYGWWVVSTWIFVWKTTNSCVVSGDTDSETMTTKDTSTSIPNR